MKPIEFHVAKRFRQRYGVHLTHEIMHELLGMAARTDGVVDPDHPDREHVWVDWHGQRVGLVFRRSEAWIVTFLPPSAADQTPGIRFRRGRRARR